MLKYYKNVVKYNENVKYGIGIITGWKDTDIILNNLSATTQKKIVTCGNLYTENGINYIIANLFLNPHITDLIIIEDSDLNNNMAVGVKAIIEFLETKKLTFETKFQFTEEQLEEFTNYFRNHFRIVKRKDLESTIKEIDIIKKDWCSITELKEKEIELTGQLSNEKIGFTIRANTAYEAWNRSLKLIHSYGSLKTSDYDEEQLELINMSIIIRNEKLDNPSMLGYLGITEEELNEYAKTLLTKEKPDGVKYTYGNRYLEIYGYNQFEYMVDELKKKKYSRRAVATLWDPQKDIQEDEVPCIDMYQALIQDDYLYLIAYLRSNDLYNAWPRNIYGILKIQEELCKKINCKKGYVNTIAGSAHVYSRNFKDLEEKYKNRSISFCEEDERGYFTVSIENNQIKTTFYNIRGDEVISYYGKSASELRAKCTFYISNLDHAFYLGQELMKAELALKNNLSYIQDQGLNIKQKVKNK